MPQGGLLLIGSSYIRSICIPFRLATGNLTAARTKNAIGLRTITDLASNPFVLPNHDSKIYQPVFNPNIKWLMAGSDTAVRLWQMDRDSLLDIAY
jgi:hypothetical protein